MQALLSAAALGSCIWPLAYTQETMRLIFALVIGSGFGIALKILFTTDWLNEKSWLGLVSAMVSVWCSGNWLLELLLGNTPSTGVLIPAIFGNFGLIVYLARGEK
jgi:hypothetical protein